METAHEAARTRAYAISEEHPEWNAGQIADATSDDPATRASIAREMANNGKNHDEDEAHPIHARVNRDEREAQRREKEAR